MALVAGTQLGRHKTLGLLAVGGMGEVYRAHERNISRNRARWPGLVLSVRISMIMVTLLKTFSRS